MDQDLAGKTILVTGANSGIGFEASVVLASRGATVVMVARDPEKGQRALADVRARSGSERVSLLLADFSSQASIRALAEQFRAAHDRLDVLVNNAGGVSDTRKLTVDGIEQTFAVNHLGYFLLTSLLLDRLEASAPARVVNVASRGHRRGTLDLEDVGYERGGYSIMGAYCRSKLANVLFTNELARRMEGKGVTANSLHPGGVATNIWAHAPGWTKPILSVIGWFAFITPAEGAEPIIHLAASPDLEGRTGEYWNRLKREDAAPLGLDVALAGKLWDLSDRLVAPR